MSIDACSADRSRARKRLLSVHVVRGHITVAALIVSFLVILFIILVLLWITASHSYVTTNPDPATLLGHDTTEGGTFRQARELLGAEHIERLRLHFQTEVNMHSRCGGIIGIGYELSTLRAGVGVIILILGLLELLEKVEAQTVLALVAD